jgi:hypothetical protein
MLPSMARAAPRFFAVSRRSTCGAEPARRR